MAVFQNIIIKALLRIIIGIILIMVVLNIEAAVTTILQNYPDSILSGIWLKGLISFSAGMAVTLLLILLLSRGRLSSYGFRVPTNMPLLRIFLLGLGVGIVANITAALLPGEGLTFMEDYPFLYIVIFVWIYRSIYEEILMRGLVQSFLSPLKEFGFVVYKVRISLPVLLSALFFALIHIMLLTMGVDIFTVLGIVVFGFILGIIAGYYRELTDSLIPAVVVHALFNISGNIVESLIGIFR